MARTEKAAKEAKKTLNNKGLTLSIEIVTVISDFSKKVVEWVKAHYDPSPYVDITDENQEAPSQIRGEPVVKYYINISRLG